MARNLRGKREPHGSRFSWSAAIKGVNELAEPLFAPSALQLLQCIADLDAQDEKRPKLDSSDPFLQAAGCHSQTTYGRNGVLAEVDQLCEASIFSTETRLLLAAQLIVFRALFITHNGRQSEARKVLN